MKQEFPVGWRSTAKNCKFTAVLKWVLENEDY